MRAMILAAGRGERMRPLTDTTPKPMLKAGGKPLIVWHIERLVAAGIHDIIINHAWLGEQIVSTLGDGQQYGARLQYSPETTALETAGGIRQALPFFQDQAFVVINGDIWCDWDASAAFDAALALQQHQALAWILLVSNPGHNAEGDFLFPGLCTDKLTFSGIGVYQPALFADLPAKRPLPLAPLLHQTHAKGRLLGCYHAGQWTDVGTPRRLEQLNRNLVSRPDAR